MHFKKFGREYVTLWKKRVLLHDYQANKSGAKRIQLKRLL